MNTLLRAIEFARKAHSGQKRKYTGEDYIWHTIEVATIVSTVAHTEEMLIAAVLHDTVEDTEVTLDDIESEFGWPVAQYVENLTDVSHADDGVRWMRKKIDREHTAKAYAAAKTIKLADLISNTRSIVEHDKEFAKVYIKEKEALLEVLTEGDEYLYEVASDLVKKAKEELGL
jgi:(p)ppGpp synthase/HD superfamily hydrolase